MEKPSHGSVGAEQKLMTLDTGPENVHQLDARTLRDLALPMNQNIGLLTTTTAQHPSPSPTTI